MSKLCTNVEPASTSKARAEMHESFVSDALAAAEAMDAGAAVYAGDEVHAYLIKRASGSPVEPPRPVPKG